MTFAVAESLPIQSRTITAWINHIRSVQTAVHKLWPIDDLALHVKWDKKACHCVFPKFKQNYSTELNYICSFKTAKPLCNIKAGEKILHSHF